MNKLTYKQILSDFDVFEEGDFFRHYRLPIGSFILFSPGKEKISCIELCNFTEITPEDLGLLLDKPIFIRTEAEEFTFDVVTDKEKILQYLFDLGFFDNKTNYFSYHVQPGEGYLLNCISANKKTRSVNLLHTINNSVGVKFDNLLAYHDNSNTNSSNIYVTFDPLKYGNLLTDANINRGFHLILLASANNLLFDKVYEYNKNTSVILGNEDPLLILKLYCYYLNKREPEFIYVESDYSQILVGLKKDIFSVTEVMVLMNKCIEYIRSEFGSDISTFYDIKASGTYTYISFRNTKNLIFTFNRIFREVFKANLSINTVL